MMAKRAIVLGPPMRDFNVPDVLCGVRVSPNVRAWLKGDVEAIFASDRYPFTNVGTTLLRRYGPSRVETGWGNNVDLNEAKNFYVFFKRCVLSNLEYYLSHTEDVRNHDRLLRVRGYVVGSINVRGNAIAEIGCTRVRLDMCDWFFQQVVGFTPTAEQLKPIDPKRWWE